MKTLSKIEYLKRWLESGKSITNGQSLFNFNYFRLSDGIYKLKKRGMWIINIGKPGEYAKYIMLDRGLVKNKLIKGFRITIVDAHYINGFQDMEIYIIATNGVICVDLTVNEDAFRDKKVMENKLKKALK